MYLPYAKLKNKKDLSFLEIKLSNIIHNYSTIKSFVDDEVIVASVVKADAYGIGILKVVKTLHNIGCQHFFVNTLTKKMYLFIFLLDISVLTNTKNII